ncbi:MAG: DUF1634 domain-containing protein [Planctomycetota bacterium]|jgi:hypothetical protein
MSTEGQQDKASPEQILYARVLQVGMFIGLAALFVTFFLYAMGVMAPAVPLDELSEYWTGEKGDPEIRAGVDRYLDAINKDFLHREHAPTGWSWLGLLGYGDFVNFIGIAILAAVTIICYLAILPLLIRRKDKAFLLMAVAEIVVLVLAASGVLAGGH